MPLSRTPWPSLLPILGCSLWLAGCDSSTGPSGQDGTGPELAAGSYFVQYDGDDLYKYEQYFVVQPGHRWQFVEYGYEPSTKNLCQVTRQKGVYSSTDSTITLTGTAGGESIEKCGTTKADFDAYPFRSDRSPAETFPIRNASAAGFEAKDFFRDSPSGWQTYSMKPDPYGFF